MSGLLVLLLLCGEIDLRNRTVPNTSFPLALESVDIPYKPGWVVVAKNSTTFVSVHPRSFVYDKDVFTIIACTEIVGAPTFVLHQWAFSGDKAALLAVAVFNSSNGKLIQEQVIATPEWVDYEEGSSIYFIRAAVEALRPIKK